MGELVFHGDLIFRSETRQEFRLRGWLAKTLGEFRYVFVPMFAGNTVRVL